MGKKSRRTKNPWLQEACEQWYRRRVRSATTCNCHALTILHFVAIIMCIMCLLPGSLAACFARVCDCILHGAARKSTVQATEEAGTKVHIKGLSKDIQFNGRVGHITGGTTFDGRVGVKIIGGKTLAIKKEHLELVREDSSGTGFASNQRASDLPDDSRLKKGNGICPNVSAVAVVEAANFSQAVFCVAATPLLLTRMFGQCSKAVIRAGIRSPLLPLFAIAATKSAMCEAAMAKSCNTKTETMRYAHTSHFSGLCNMLVPMITIAMILATNWLEGRRTVSRKRSADAHTSKEIDAAECPKDDRERRTDVNWLDGTLMALDEAASCATSPVGVSRCVDVMDGSRYVNEDEGLVLTDAEREAGKSIVYEEDTEDPGGLPTSSLNFDPFDPMPPSLQMKRNALLSKCTSDKPNGVLLGGAGKRKRPSKEEGATAEKLTGRWTAEEHSLFLRGLEMHGEDNKKIAALVKSRTVTQVKSHAQKHFQKLAKKEAGPAPLSLDPFYQARREAALEEALTPEPKRSKHYREQESNEAKKARLEKDSQRYHEKKAKDHRVEFSDIGIPKLCDSVDIEGPMKEAQRLICRTGCDGSKTTHQANVCVICDRIIQLGAEIHKLSKQRITRFKNQLGVDSYNEHHGELHQEVVKQYQVAGLEGLLLSPRSRRSINPDNGDITFEVCSQCLNGMKSADEGRESPPKHAIANGFAIGSIPTTFAVKIDGKLETFEVNDEMISALLSAAIAPVRPHAWIFSYTAGQCQKICGNYQFFEADLSRMGGAFSYLRESWQCDQILVVLSGAMTPKQKEIARQRAEIDTRLFLGLLTWFIGESGHPGYEGIPLPTECPRPIIIEDRESKYNTDEPGNKDIEKEFEEGTCFFPTVGDPDATTYEFKTSQEFAMSILRNHSAPTMIASGGNYARNSEMLLENVRPIQFPFGNGGPSTPRRNPISQEECLKHYVQLSLPQFMRADFVLLVRAMLDRKITYNTARFQCNSLSNEVGPDGKKRSLAEEISTMKEEDLVAALEEEEGHETGIAGRFLKAVSASCRSLGVTAEAAKTARRKNFALQDYFGAHSLFITVCPDDECSFRVRLYVGAGEMVSLFAPLSIVLIFLLYLGEMQWRLQLHMTAILAASLGSGAGHGWWGS
jgi:SHAQKYF class myb-like DNA-binding protein